MLGKPLRQGVRLGKGPKLKAPHQATSEEETPRGAGSRDSMCHASIVHNSLNGITTEMLKGARLLSSTLSFELDSGPLRESPNLLNKPPSLQHVAMSALNSWLSAPSG